MLKRIALGLLGICMVAIFVVAARIPANAASTNCVKSDDTAITYCINFSKDAGPDGFYVYWVRASCDPFFYGIGPVAGWDDIAIDGHIMQISKYSGVLKWSQPDSNANVHLDSGGTNQCTRTWTVNEHYPDMNHLYTVYTFTEQRNNNSDIFDAVDMDFINGG